MANPFRDMSVIMQGLVALAIAVILVLAGLYVPGSPVAQERADYDVATRLHLAVDFDGDAGAQVVEEQRLVRLGDPELPRQAGVLDRGER